MIEKPSQIEEMLRQRPQKRRNFIATYLAKLRSWNQSQPVIMALPRAQTNFAS